ncbi:MAG TPA: hypothetical protein DD490_11110 [Acidobacteria bacterium]|nr:hypothetical protein [Acidobacteriota bacterium]
MVKTEIKALEMVRRIRDEHYEKTKNMSDEERLQFYRREAEAVNAEALSHLARRPVAASR